MTKGSSLRLVSWLLMGLAISFGLYAGSNIAFDLTSQTELASAWDRTHKAAPPIAPATSSDPFQLNVQRPRLAIGQPLAKMSVPSIAWNGIVLEGTDDRVLSGGPGHLVGTAYPGEPDNVVISNHNTYSTAFGNLKAGQQIILDTDYGHFVYKVTGFKVISNKDTSVTAHSTRGQLTFTTCYPLWAGAFATQRYVTMADLVTA
ncbi:MAG: sortase [Chloroflexota bacterium]|jgi:sortase A|nr:sortase [Chloroflexota bacterium]